MELCRRNMAADAALRTALLGLGLAIAVTLAANHFVRAYETQRQMHHVGELLSTVESTLRIACFVGDETLANEIAGGLLSNPTVSAVRITAGEKVLADMRKPSAKVGADPAFIVARQVRSPFGHAAPVGDIHLVADRSAIRAQAVRYSNLSVSVLLIEIIAVVGAVVWIILRRVVHPIRRLSQSTHTIDVGEGGRVAVPPGCERNEIGTLAGDFNRLIDNMAGLLATEQAMREKAVLNEQRFRALAENMPDIIVRYDRECRRVYLNPAFERQTGASTEQVLNRPTHDREVWSPLMPCEEYTARLGKVMETGQPDHILLEWVGSDGKLASHEMYVVAERDAEGRVVGALAIGRDMTQHKAIEMQLMHQATHDTLTGLPNRFLLKDRMQQALVQAAREQRHVAVVFVDLDNFKTVNDTLGHEVGDELLKTVAYRMSSSLRGSDTVARLGGDEFVILLQDGVRPQEVDSIARKIFDRVCGGFEISGHVIYTNASMGVAVFPQDGQDAETLMRNADTAMYVAKSNGRNNYQFFSAEMNSEVREWMEMSTLLREAVERSQFSLNYQPKVDLRSGRVRGFEALIRWHHPEKGWVSPARFIPIAEECGLIDAIGAWVLEEACRQLREWLDQGLPPVRVAVNLSAAQCHGDGIQQRIGKLLEDYRLEGQWLEVEITESIVMHDAETAIRTFWDLRAMGVHVAIDDFGTGYSSLSYLKKFPVESLKIDKSFVDDIEHDPNDLEIICAIIAMAHSLGLSVVAEGVENQAQLDFLRRAGCDEIQGYFFSKPLPASDITRLLQSGKQLSLDSSDIALVLGQ